jgi:hypothetical protein
MGFDSLPQPLRINQSEPVRLVYRGLEPFHRKDRREIDQCPSRLGDGDAVTTGEIRSGQDPPMDANAGVATEGARRDGHRNEGGLGSCDPPESGSCLMAEDRIRPTCEDCGHPLTAPGQLRPAHGVHPAPDRTKPAPRNPVSDRPISETQGNELPPSDDTVLPARELPRPSTDRLQTFRCYSAANAANPHLRPPGTGIANFPSRS